MNSFAFDSSLFFYDNQESLRINTPSTIDGEYYSDILAFGFSTENSLNFKNSDNAYNISAGSLGSKNFALNQLLKINQELNSKLSLSVRYLEIENFELARTQLFTGLVYKLNQFVELGGYTSLFSEKSDNDLGLSLKFNLKPESFLKLFLNYPDFSYNKRNEDMSKNLEETLNFGIETSHRIDSDHQIDIYFLRNSPLKRINFTENLVYEFSESRLGLISQHKLNLISYRLIIDFFKGEEGDYLNNESRSVWTREGLRFNSNLEYLNLALGLDYNFRKWQLNDDKIIHRNLIPYVWYKLNLKGALSSIDLGLDTSFHNASGPKNLRNIHDENNLINGRFNLRLNFKISKSSFINFLLSADIDDGSWEGGGGQFQALF